MRASNSSLMYSTRVLFVDHGQTGVLGHPRDVDADHNGQTPRLVGLLLVGAVANRALVGGEDVATRSTQVLDRVELAGDPAPDGLVQQDRRDE
jgi:hypothetical protein